jgi:hypothetical protein
MTFREIPVSVEQGEMVELPVRPEDVPAAVRALLLYGGIVADEARRFISPEERPDLYPQISDEYRAARREKYAALLAEPDRLP